MTFRSGVREIARKNGGSPPFFFRALRIPLRLLVFFIGKGDEFLPFSRVWWFWFFHFFPVGFFRGIVWRVLLSCFGITACLVFTIPVLVVTISHLVSGWVSSPWFPVLVRVLCAGRALFGGWLAFPRRLGSLSPAWTVDRRGGAGTVWVRRAALSADPGRNYATVGFPPARSFDDRSSASDEKRGETRHSEQLSGRQATRATGPTDGFGLGAHGVASERAGTPGGVTFGGTASRSGAASERVCIAAGVTFGGTASRSGAASERAGTPGGATFGGASFAAGSIVPLFFRTQRFTVFLFHINRCGAAGGQGRRALAARRGGQPPGADRAPRARRPNATARRPAHGHARTVGRPPHRAQPAGLEVAERQSVDLETT